MLTGIGGPEGVPAFIDKVRACRSEPPGFGHRVYRTYDPRARILKEHATKVFAVTGRPRIFETALALEEAAAADSCFIERSLYPTVDFYETIIYHVIGFPAEMFPVLFAMPLRRLGGALGRDDAGPGTAHVQAAPDLRRPGGARIHAAGTAWGEGVRADDGRGSKEAPGGRLSSG